MNSAPPMAFFHTPLAWGAVWPMCSPSGSSRVTLTTGPRRTWPALQAARDLPHGLDDAQAGQEAEVPRGDAAAGVGHHRGVLLTCRSNTDQATDGWSAQPLASVHGPLKPVAPRMSSAFPSGLQRRWRLPAGPGALAAAPPRPGRLRRTQAARAPGAGGHPQQSILLEI